MSEDNFYCALSGFSAGCILTTLIGAFIISPYEAGLWQRDAISRGVAEYDKITGEWKWTVEKVKAEE